MTVRIQFSRQTVKALTTRWEDAFRKGDLRLVRRIAALLLLAKGLSITDIAGVLSVAEQTIYNWGVCLYRGTLGQFALSHRAGASG